MQQHVGDDCPTEDVRRPERRVSPRIAVSIPVVVTRAQQRRDPTFLSELSREGCRLESLRATVGETLSIKAHGLGGLDAVVVWSSDISTGCRFVRPLHPAIFDHLTGPRAPGSAEPMS